jgi:hypothetical protein
MKDMKRTETTPATLARTIRLKMRDWGFQFNIAASDPGAMEVTVPQPDGSHQTFIVTIRPSEAV